jgi:hypothetical protein
LAPVITSADGVHARHRRAALIGGIAGRVVRDRSQRDLALAGAAQPARLELRRLANVAVGAAPDLQAVAQQRRLAAVARRAQRHRPQADRDTDPDPLLRQGHTRSSAYQLATLDPPARI